MGGGVSSNTSNVAGVRESRLPWRRRNRNPTDNNGGAAGAGAVGENGDEAELSEPPIVAPSQSSSVTVDTVVTGAALPSLLPSTLVVDTGRPQMPTVLLVSPRQEAYLKSSVPFTPKSSMDAHTFRYYCPLCMEYFEGIFKSKCCGNYTCLGCTVDYLGAKGLGAETANEILGKSDALKHIPCPHCFTSGFIPLIVNAEEEIRDYKGTATKSKLTISPGAATSSGGIAFGDGRSQTPLKVGDTFEDLKRKMIPYAAAKAVPIETGEKIKSVLTGHNKENCKLNCDTTMSASAHAGMRISPRSGLQQSNSHPAIGYIMGGDSGHTSSSSSSRGIALSPTGDLSAAPSFNNNNSINNNNNNNSTSTWSCPTGRRTVRLGVAQSTGNVFPSAGSSPEYTDAVPVGRNLFDEVTAEDVDGSGGGGGESDGGREEVGDVVGEEGVGGGEGLDGGLVANNNNHDNGNRVHAIATDLVASLSSLMSSDIKLAGDVVRLSTFDMTPRTRVAMSHVASVLVEEILEHAVERQNDMGRVVQV